jgi:dihydrolipoamide dehydrogenase
MASQRGVEVVQGAAHFTGAHELEIVTAGSRRKLTFGQAIVAAGSRVIELPGLSLDDPRVWDSTDALELSEIPQRLLLVGGGIVGLEMAMVYGALGSEITVVELLDGLVPGCDRDLVRPLERRLKKELGASMHLETRVTKLDTEGDELVAHLEGEKAPESIEVDRVLVSVGRRPNGDRLAAEAAGLEVDERGFIPVDRQMRTNLPHIFAIGDITGQPMLAHKATHEGKVAAEVAAGETSAFDARVIPSVAYTDPEIAWVGLTETDAKAEGTPYEVASFPWAASGRALGMGRSEGKTKLLFDPETKRIVGGGIVGPNAGDLIAEVALAIEMDCLVGDIALTVHPHPTLSETVAFAAEVFDGTITDLYLKR